MTTPQVPSFTLSVTPAAVTLSRGNNSRNEAPRTHPRQMLTVRIAASGGLTGVNDVYVVDPSATGPGNDAANWQYVHYLGGHSISGPTWLLMVELTTMPSSVPLGLHRCFVQARINAFKPWIKVPLNITIVEP